MSATNSYFQPVPGENGSFGKVKNAADDIQKEEVVRVSKPGVMTYETILADGTGLSLLGLQKVLGPLGI